jgi:hypothetical protein
MAKMAMPQQIPAVCVPPFGDQRSPLQVQRPNAVRPYIRGARRAEDLPL